MNVGAKPRSSTSLIPFPGGEIANPVLRTSISLTRIPRWGSVAAQTRERAGSRRGHRPRWWERECVGPSGEPIAAAAPRQSGRCICALTYTASNTAANTRIAAAVQTTPNDLELRRPNAMPPATKSGYGRRPIMLRGSTRSSPERPQARTERRRPQPLPWAAPRSAVLLRQTAPNRQHPSGDDQDEAGEGPPPFERRRRRGYQRASPARRWPRSSLPVSRALLRRGKSAKWFLLPLPS